MNKFKVCTTYRGESINGIHISILKSALQKYIRRSELEKGLLVIGYLSVLDEGSMESRRLRTNITNRLIVCMSEEISICEMDLPGKMKKLYLEWTRSRSNIPTSVAIWIQMFTLLCSSRKCRIVSDYKTVFFLPPISGTAEMHTALLDKYDILEPDIPENADVKKLFQAALKRKSSDAFVYLRYIYSSKRSSDDWIWETVAQSVKRREVKSEIYHLQFFHNKMTHAEKPIYLYNAVLSTLNESSIDSTLVVPRLDMNAVKKCYESAVAFDGKFDDYVYDIHTSANKERKTRTTFAEEGAYIVNEDKRFLNKKYREMYIYYKTLF